MSEVDTVFNKSSKQLLSLAYTLKNNKDLGDRVVESFLVKRNVETIKKKKLKHKFMKHPEPLSSESEISTQPVARGCSESSLCLSYNKSCDISVTHSEHSTLSPNCVKYKKLPRQVVLSSSQSDSDTLTTVRLRKPEIKEKEPVESTVSLNKIQHHSQSTGKLKQQAVSFNMKTVPSKADVPNNIHPIAPDEKTGSQKKNIDQKLRNYLQRISCSVEEIRVAMGKPAVLPDGAEDWERARVRTSEFCARFSRNYLYPLGREILKLQETAKKSGNITNHTAKNIHQCLFKTHLIVMQAFQTYRKNMASMEAETVADKLQYVIDQTCTLCDIHTKFLNLEQTGSSKRETLIDVLLRRCNALSEKILETTDRRSSVMISPATRLSLMGYKVNFKKPAKPKPHKKTALETRLSMYSITSGIRSKDAFWRKTVEALAKDKLRYNHVQSRYKTVGYKHRPPNEKPTVVELPTKSKLFGKRSSCMLRNTPISSPHNEDDIITMVEMQKEMESNASYVTRNDVLEEHCNNVINKEVKNVPPVTDCEQQSNNAKDMQLQAFTPFIQGLCQQVCTKDGEAMTQKQLEILLKGLLGMALDGKINTYNNDKETGPKKNGFTPHTIAVNDLAHAILQNTEEKYSSLDLNGNLPKNDELHAEGTTTKDETTQKIYDKDKALENRKSLDTVKNLESGTFLSEKIDGSGGNNKNNIEEMPQANKVGVDEGSVSKTKKAENSQLSKSKNKRRQTVTVTGAKNAQLICIRDEDSIIESPDTSILTPATNKTCEQVKESGSAKETPASCEEGGIHTNSKKNTSKLGSNTKGKAKAKGVQHSASSPKATTTKISRLPKNLLKKLAMVPKTQALNVIQYKLQYSKFTRGNHMYRKSSKVQPWVIVDTISDCLLNDLLLSIAKEIQVDQVLENMYRSEFQ